MILTETKAWKNYKLLCSVLKRNNIVFQRNDKTMNVRCAVPGKDFEQQHFFTVDPSKMLITLFSPVPVSFSRKEACSLCSELCRINCLIKDGCFCADTAEGIVYFRSTISFYGSEIGAEHFGYMLSNAADALEEYYNIIEQAKR